MSERRAHPRFQYDGRCWLRDADAERFVFLADVSASGARVSTLRPLAVGEQTILRWRTHDEPRRELAVEVVARVIWSRQDDSVDGSGAGSMGLCFEEIRTPEPLTRFLEARDGSKR